MNSHRNPTRRNRNIGTSKQGLGDDNSLVIPELFKKDDRYFAERLVNPREHTFVVHGDKRTALVEEPSKGFFYGCTISDLERLLNLAPEKDICGLNMFIFRNPTRKQRILSPVWGRLIYYATLGHMAGSAICFESSNLSSLLWSKSINPEWKRELDRLRVDGHVVKTVKRGIDIHISHKSFRATTLFRTALHEVGHYVDWMRNAICFEGSEDEEEAALRAFYSKPSAMKEDFAHRYAAKEIERLKLAGKAPFPVLWETDSMKLSGIKREWFVDEDVR